MCLSLGNRMYLNTKELIRSLVIIICSQLPYCSQTHTFYFEVLEMECISKCMTTLILSILKNAKTKSMQYWNTKYTHEVIMHSGCRLSKEVSLLDATDIMQNYDVQNNAVMKKTSPAHLQHSASNTGTFSIILKSGQINKNDRKIQSFDK